MNASRAETIINRFFPVPAYLLPISPAFDISQSSIKYLSGAVKDGVILPDVFVEKMIDPGIIEKGEIKDASALLQTITSFSKEYDLKTAHISLPEEGSYVYPLPMDPNLTPEEQRARIEFSLSEHVPISPELVVYDFVAVPGESMVSVVAYDARVSRGYESLFLEADIIPLTLEPHIIASARAAVPKQMQESTLLIDIGKTRTSLAIVYAGVTLTTTTVPIGGSCITDVIASILHLSHKDAYEIKMNEGLSLTKKHPELVTPLLTCLDGWVAHMMNFEYLWKGGLVIDSIKIPEVSQVILSGGEAAVPGYAEWMEKRFRLPMVIADVWVNMFSYDTYIPRIDRPSSARLATVAGLLMNNIT